MKHVTSIQLCAFLDDVLVGAPDDETARHLATCAMCRARYEAWCHVDDSLRELLGRDPDEHAMEQRTAWVEIAVTAERKGLPAPEFTELRIPLEHNPPPVLRAGLASAAPSMPQARVLPPAPPANPVAPAPPAGPSAALKRPVLHVAPAAAPAPEPFAVGVPSAAGSGYARGNDAKHARAPEPGPRGAPAGGGSGYARRPSPPAKGLASLARRPGPWITLLLVAAFVAAFPLGIFRIPRIRLAPHAVEELDPDVQRTAAHTPTKNEREVKPARSGKSTARGTASSSAPKASEGPEDPDTPDASILFDLPALEPEDGDPDPVVTPPNRLTPSEGRDAPAPGKDDNDDTDRNSDSPGICGEVRSPQGAPIEGALVYLASPARMVRTDRQGRFCVVCPPGARTLRIEALGRATVTRTLDLGNARLETRFTLDAAN